MKREETLDAPASSPHAARVRAAIDDAFTRRAAGEELTDESLLAAHPELAGELAPQLARLRVIAAARQQAERSPAHPDATVDYELAGGGPIELLVRCPRCHAGVPLPAGGAADTVTCSSCGAGFSLVGDDDAPARRTCGQFELLETLGSGGFGTVYKARDPQLNRLVAVKIPRQGVLSAAEMEDFLREARIAAQLKHPQIVSVLEIGRDGDTCYIVSDLVEGQNLFGWMESRRVLPREAAELCARIARVLHYAHVSGVVHRDLKPGNVMIDTAGAPHLMDFGLAKRDSGETTIASEGQVLGTPAYMSPEQAQGLAHESDRRTDVYSLGVILYELLTGERPFRGDARMLIHQAAHDEPPSPRKLNSRVPRDLETICLKCLEKQPGRRYASMAALADDLERWLAGENIAARPIGRLERGWRWGRRHPLAAGLLATTLAFFALTTLAAVSIARARTARLEQALHEIDAFSRLELMADCVRRAAEDPALAALLAEPPDDANGTVRRLVRQLHRDNDRPLAGTTREHPFASWLVLDARGRVLAVFPDHGRITGTDKGHRDYFRGAVKHLGQRRRESIHVSLGFRSENDQQHKFAVSAPVQALDGDRPRLLGVVAATVAPGTIEQDETLVRELVFWAAVALSPVAVFLALSGASGVRESLSKRRGRGA